MNTITNIRISRCGGGNPRSPLESRVIAVVHLNTIKHEFGKPVMVNYLKPNREVDTIVAIGIKDGTGPDCYSIISEGGKLYVGGVYEELPDVSSLVHNIPYVAKVNGQWKLVYINDDNAIRLIGDLDPDDIIFNLEDGHDYYYKNGEVVRDDSIIDLLDAELNVLKFGGLTLSVEPVKDTYKRGESSVKPTFAFTVMSNDGTDVSSRCIVTLSSSNPNEAGQRIGNNVIATVGINNTTEYTITATYTIDSTEVVDAKKVKIWFVDPVLVGDSGREELWNGQDPLVLYFNLHDETSMIRVPSSLPEFNHIYDAHGLDYIEDYRITTSNGYKIYEKIDAVTINNFKQAFTI